MSVSNKIALPFIISIGIIALTLFSINLNPINTSSSSITSSDQWTNYKQEYAHVFTNEQQDKYRSFIYKQNMIKIQKHNSNDKNGYKLGINQFAHLTQKQFSQMFSKSHVPTLNQPTISYIAPPSQTDTDTNDVDWQKQGKISAVKSQGTCDAGYAFCTNGLAQSYTRFVNTPLQLSDQQIVDCSQDYTTYGCNSGSRAGTIKYLQEQGVVTQSKYAYVGVKQTCKITSADFKLTKKIVTTTGCTQLKNQLSVSPLTVAVNTQNWQLYKSGVFSNCGSEVQHDILLIGYTESYWRLKNSWGVRWGEYGYIRLAQGDTCGVCSKPGFGFQL